MERRYRVKQLRFDCTMKISEIRFIRVIRG